MKRCSSVTSSDELRVQSGEGVVVFVHVDVMLFCARYCVHYLILNTCSRVEMVSKCLVLLRPVCVSFSVSWRLMDWVSGPHLSVSDCSMCWL